MDHNTTNSDEFIKNFNNIEKTIKIIAEATKHEPFWVLVNKAAQKNGVIKDHRDELVDYSRLRNAIVHSGSKKTMAEPHDEAVARIKQLYEMISKPKTAGELFRKNVFICNLECILLDVVKSMAEHNYTQVPIYQDEKLLGFLTESVVVSFLAHTGESGIFQDFSRMKVEAALPYLGEQFYRVVSADTDVYQVLNYFLEFVDRKERLECVLITPSGARNERPVGIATTWDVPTIKELQL